MEVGMEATFARRLRDIAWSRRRVAVVVSMVLAAGATSGGLASAFALGAAPTPPQVSLPTWQSTYAWSDGDEYAGWHPRVLTSDRGAYGLEAATAGGPGLWAWPTGGREYSSGGAEWVYRAPGTTRI